MIIITNRQWTLVGGGTYDAKKTVRSLKKILPKKATLIQVAVKSLVPKQIQSL